jgi:hypothetical protein
MRTLFVCFACALVLVSAPGPAQRLLSRSDPVRTEARDAPVHLALATGAAKRRPGSRGG